VRSREALGQIEGWAADRCLDFRHDPVSGYGAAFSRCGHYRYLLWRFPNPRAALFGIGMLNPSKADEHADDATIARCRRIAAQAGCANLLVWNLFAFRATLPAHLKLTAQPAGSDNDAAISLALGLCRRTVIAWGNHGSHRGRAGEVLANCVAAGTPLAVLGLTGQGQPRHPLYLASKVRPRRWHSPRLPSPAARCHVD
jgi:hypothetical protein